jgi:hypothetical protein
LSLTGHWWWRARTLTAAASSAIFSRPMPTGAPRVWKFAF